MTHIIQKEGEGFTLSASGFEAGVDTLNALFGESLLELLKASQSVGKQFMLEFAAWLDETGVELEFGDVDAEHWLCHGQLLSNEMRRGSNLQMQAQLHRSGFGYCPTSMRCMEWMPGASLTV